MGFLDSFGPGLAGILGGLIGAAIPGVGFAIGFAVGSMVGSLLFTETPTVESGRLEDLEIQVSTYGQAIPDLYGTMRMAGNVIWVEGNALSERVVKKKSNGVKYKNYKYSASMAICICRGADAGAIGEIDGIKKIWANSKLVYDAQNDVKRPYVSMKVYKGTTTQTADPLISADVGAANCPAYRGRAYVVLKDFALEDFGNRIPTFEFEVSRGGGAAYPSNIAVATHDFRDWGLALNGVAWMLDEEMGRLWFVESTAIKIYDVETATLVKSLPITWHEAGATYTQRSLVPNYWQRVAYLAEAKSAATNKTVFTVLDMDEMELVGSSEHTSVGNGYHTYSNGLRQVYTVAISSGHCELYAGVANVDTDDLMIDAGVLPRLGLLWLERWEDLAGEIYPYPVATPIDEALGLAPLPMDPPRFVVMGTSDIVVAQVSVGTDPTTGDPAVTYADSVYTYTAGSAYFPACFYDYRRNRLVIWNTVHTDYFYKLLDLDTLTMTQVDTAHPVAGGGFDYSNDRYLFWDPNNPGADDVHVYDAETGTLLLSRDGVLSTSAWNNGWFIFPRNSAGGALSLTYGGANKIFLETVPSSSPSLPDVVSEISLKTKLTASDIDVTGLSGTVTGYAVTRNASARAQLEPLRKAYRFDGVESDYQVVYGHRSGTAVKEIASDDLIGETDITLTRKQEAELPREIVLSYQEPEFDYQVASQRARKSTGNTDSATTIDLPMTLTADEAAQTAEILLHQDHLARTGKSVTVPRKYLALDPGDVVQIPRGDAYYYALLTSSNFADGQMSLEGVKDHPRVYNSQASGQVPEFTAATVYNPYLAKAFYLDCAMLFDADNDAGWYWGAGLVKGSWKGVDLLTSADGQEWGAIGSETEQITHGMVQGTLGDADETVWDWTNSLTVQMANGAALSSASESEVLGGENMALVGTSAGWEVIGFQSVTDNGDGNYTLTGLLRGRRGTEWMCGAHVSGASFVLVDDGLSRIWDSRANIGVEQYAKTVPFGLSADLVRPFALTTTAAGLKPYAPCHVEEAIDYSAKTIDLTWTRRTRIQAGYDVACVPVLGEESEAYEIDIINDDTGETVRTVTGLTSPSWQYTNALFLSDFGANIGNSLASITYRVYQLSAVVGRGYVAELSSALSGAISAPDDVPDLVGWYDADDITTLWQDASKTTQVAANGDTIACWEDKSGGGRDFVEYDSSRNPRYDTNILNGKPVGYFSADWLKYDGVFSSGDFTVFAVAKFDDTSERVLLSQRSATSGNPITMQIGPDNGGDYSLLFRNDAGALTKCESGTNVDTVDHHLWTAKQSGTAMSLAIDTVEDSTATHSGGTCTVTRSALGGIAYNYSATYAMNGNIAELVIYNRALSAEETTAVEAHLNSKWGL